MAENLTFKLDVDSSQAKNDINQFFQTFEQGAAKAKATLNKEFGQGVQTEIKIQFKNGQLVAKEIQKAKQESNRLGDTWKAINGKLGRTPNELRKQQQVLKGLIGDTAKYRNGTREITNEWRQLQGRLREVNSAMRSMGNGNFLTGFAGRFAAVQTAANLATSGIMGVVRGIQELGATAVRLEVLSLQLEAFTGGAAEAEQTFGEFVRIASNSPLNLEQVAQAGKIMMAFGLSTEDAVKATEQLSIVSAATGGDINLLARNLGQIAAQGRAYTRDLTQFAIQGIPIWEQLSIVTGKSTAALKEMAREGQIGFQEVTAAMNNMTQEGTAFNQIAERMQETFQGRLARIEAAFQQLALKAVESFNTLDQAFGGIVSGSMKLFADGIFLIANNFDKITIALASATAATVAFFTVQNWGIIVAAIKGAVVAIGALATGKKLAAVAAAALQAVMGNWAGVAAGIAAAAVTATALGVAFENAKAGAVNADGSVQDLTTSLGQLDEKEQKMAGGRYDFRVIEYQNARKEADKYKTALDGEVKKLKAIQGEIKRRFEAERNGLKETLQGLKDKLREEQQGLRDAKREIDIKYKEEKMHLDETLQKIRDKYREEIGALQEMGPKQKELYEYEKKKLKEEIASGQLDKEALLNAQARLERMESQEKIAKLRKQQAKEEEPILEALKQSEKDRKQAIEEVTQKYEERIKQIESEKTAVEQQIRDAEQAYRDEVKAIDDAIKSAERLEGAIEMGTTAVQEQIKIVKDLTQKWKNAERAAINAANAIRRANAEKLAGNSNRASGGPVTGGTTYTVNEFGKEAFLSASGKLSMINAPAWGDWKAPGKGTVIPAHLTKQLDIPSGGVNLNKAASANAGRAGVSGNNVAALARAIASSVSGDTISNNVTIQSANPTHTANNVMTQLAKFRYVRYH